MNHEAPIRIESWLGKVFWFAGKCVISLLSIITIQHIIEQQTGYTIPFANLFWCSVFVILFVKMWS